MTATVLSLKIDVDTERGTRIGVRNLLNLFTELDIPATFLFSLGPDNTGRALKRIFRPGFLKKVSRTSVISTYGIRTLLNGVLWPGPHIAKKHAAIMRETKQLGHEVGIHCYDHIRWQDGVHKMSTAEVFEEFDKALNSFKTVFSDSALTAGAAGWQANEKSLAAYDRAHLLYASDCRGHYPFFPQVKNTKFNTLQIPTTLPTLDELLGRPEYPKETLIDYYLSLIQPGKLNIFTMHAEIEGMAHLAWFREFLIALKNKHVVFITMATLAEELLRNPKHLPTCEFLQGEVDGRSGVLAIQGNLI